MPQENPEKTERDREPREKRGRKHQRKEEGSKRQPLTLS